MMKEIGGQMVNQPTAARGRSNVVDTGSQPDTFQHVHKYHTRTTSILHKY